MKEKEVWQLTEKEYLNKRENELLKTKTRCPERYYRDLNPKLSRYNWECQMSKYYKEFIEEHKIIDAEAKAQSETEPEAVPESATQSEMEM